CRATGRDEFLEVAVEIGNAMARDFAAAGDYHPILALPDKQPVERDPLRWSRAPGCYQLKAAMAWWDLQEATGDHRFRQFYDDLLETLLRTYDSFLPGHPQQEQVMDRL